MGVSNDRAGQIAETLAALFLRAKGFGILQRRYTTKVGEVDIIAQKRDLLLFVEVKLRSNSQMALYSIEPRQQQRITRAAEAFLQANPEYAFSNIRFDVVAFGRWSRPVHIEDAWRTQHF